MMVGSRTPPSYSQPLPLRSGRLQVGPGVALVQSPPLSEKKNTAVLRSSLQVTQLPEHGTDAVVDRGDHRGVGRIVLPARGRRRDVQRSWVQGQ